MQNEILINATPGETRVAILEKGSFSELLIERRSERNTVGSVIKGRVTRVLPGMQAAFVDIGLEKAAFLYAGDYLQWDDDAEQPEDDGGSRRGRGRARDGGARSVPRIDALLREGQEIMVQVAKEPIGTKGARITSHVAIAGRHLVLTPSGKRVGVSRRIEADRERRRLREIVERLRPPELGFIIRTAGDDAREADLEADIKYLSAVWQQVQERRESKRAPALLYAEPSLPLRVIRDVAGPETKRIMVDSESVYDEMQSFVSRFMADPKPVVERYRGGEPLFHRFGLEAQIDANLGRKVWLKSGGSLIVDQSEALTAIDVNTGRYVGRRDLEETVLKTNLEAVKEVVNQLRFRNIGGLIIIDLIDMESAENREKVHRALREAIRADKAKTNILKISELGLVEMTRKRTRENLVQQLCEPCAYCEGRGYVLSRESVTHKLLREIRRDLPRMSGRQIALTVHPRVAELLLGAEHESLAALEAELGRAVEVRARPGMHQEQFEVMALDEGPPVELKVSWLGGANGLDTSGAEEDGAEAAEDDAEAAQRSAGDASELASGADAALLEPEKPDGEPEFGDDLDAAPAPAMDAAADSAPVEGARIAGEAPEAVDESGEFRILPRPSESEEA